MKDKFTVLLIDDEYPISTTVKSVLVDDDDFEYLGCVSSREDFEILVQNNPPDLILVDLQLPSPKIPDEPYRKELNFEEGFWYIARADQISPNSKVIAFSNFFVNNPELAKEALKIGADALLPKQAGPQDQIGWDDWFKYNLRAVIRDQWQPDANIARLLVKEEENRVDSISEYEQFTNREREVLRCLAKGMTDNEICEALTIAPSTARTYIRNIIIRLHARNREHLKAILKENGKKNFRRNTGQLN